MVVVNTMCQKNLLRLIKFKQVLVLGLNRRILFVYKTPVRTFQFISCIGQFCDFIGNIQIHSGYKPLTYIFIVHASD